MKLHRIALTLMFAFCLCIVSSVDARTVKNFNKGWKFKLNPTTEAFDYQYKDQDWRKLNLPHDWAIEGDFSESNPSGCGGGALPGGIGWYRKNFTVDNSLQGKKIFIDFDGVYMNSEVWINGHYLGIRPYGYISFRYDLTPFLNYGKTNVIAVKVDNSEQPNSRWYSGCGIYRNVWMTITDPIHVDLWGTHVATPEITGDQARVDVGTTVRNDARGTREVTLITSLVDDKGVEVARKEDSKKISENSAVEFQQQIQLNNPVLWTLQNPYLYKVVSRVKSNGAQVDEYETTLGVRYFNFDPYKGFTLNGEPTKILGVCNHHDLGCLGAAVNERAIERQLQILKEMGCNGIRCSHNPPAPELLDLCDRMGFIVMDETFDMWRKKKTAHDYSRYFSEWHERDLTDHIKRDRNHPSVFVWSIGNEILEQWDQVNADTLDIQQANLLLNFASTLEKKNINQDSMHVNSLLTIKLADMVKNLDSTRPVTTGNNETTSKNLLFRSGALDLFGMNYHGGHWPGFHKNFPGDKKMIVTESTSGLMTRGYYRMPSDKMFTCPTAWNVPYKDSTFSCSSYDNNFVLWGSNHEDSWKLVKKYDHIPGMYIWTGFDYLGEPTPYWWPARSSYFGIIDLAGFPKDVYYMYQSEWTDKNVLHIFPHWNWTAGETIDVWAYYNNADEVELYLNGVSQGIRQKTEDQLHTVWRLTYEPGKIKVISRKNGKKVLSREISTAGEPAKIELIADRSLIKGDGKDLSFITVNIVDKNGNLCPNAENQVSFTVDGAGFLAGVDNGSPISHENFKAPERKAFYGKCLAVLQSNEQLGEISLTATSPGLKSAKVVVKVK